MMTDKGIKVIYLTDEEYEELKNNEHTNTKTE